MTSFATRELYGGAVTVSLPTTYIDSSDIREIPDHQEVFLSNVTLTSLIFEINEYVQQADPAALYFHFVDVIAPPDRLAGEPTTPIKPPFNSKSLTEFPVYLVEGTIVTPELDRKAPSTLPVEWQQSPPTTEALTKCWQLLVRMEKYGTDFCIRLNMPLKELVETEAIQAEEAIVKQVVQEIVATLDIKDFDLFGAE